MKYKDILNEDDSSHKGKEISIKSYKPDGLWGAIKHHVGYHTKGDSNGLNRDFVELGTFKHEHHAKAFKKMLETEK